MKRFVNYNFNITHIALACIVPKDGGTPVHKNRGHHGLVFFTGGERCFTFEDDSKILAKPNDIVYLPKNSSYSVIATIPGECYAINFDVSNDVNCAPFMHKTKNHNYFFERFKNAESAWKNKSTGYEMKCKAEAYNIICSIIKEFELGYISKSRANILQPAIDYIHNRYTENTIPISMLAEICGISEIYFRRTFKQVKGISPIKYINNLKLERAKELLSSDMYTVGQVAVLSGFHDESHFSREFKKHFDMPPSEYIKASQKN